MINNGIRFSSASKISHLTADIASMFVVLSHWHSRDWTYAFGGHLRWRAAVYGAIRLSAQETKYRHVITDLRNFHQTC